jgi:hypothetical protein
VKSNHLFSAKTETDQLVDELFKLVVHGMLFLFDAFLFKAEQKSFP